MPNFQKTLRALEIQERRRVIVRSRLLNGFLRLFKQPWTLILPLLLAVVVILAWRNRVKLSLPGSNSSLPELVELWQITLSTFIVVLALLLLWGILALLGTPRQAKKIDSALLHIGLVDRYDFGPTLLHIQPIKGTTVRKMTFYSKGIAITHWVERKDDISDVLNVHFVEQPVYGGRKGNHRNYIVLTVAPGADDQPTATLYEDDEL